MVDINSKYAFCPRCGSKLVNINSANEVLYGLCPESTCRTMIKDSNISEMDMDIYSRLQQKIDFKKTTATNGIKAYMLLKENLSGPLLVKNSKNVLSSNKTAFCIVKDSDIYGAMRQFKERFEIIKITEDMVVEVSIVEKDTWK